jgi:hypothetical protein
LRCRRFGGFIAMPPFRRLYCDAAVSAAWGRRRGYLPAIFKLTFLSYYCGVEVGMAQVPDPSCGTILRH